MLIFMTPKKKQPWKARKMWAPGLHKNGGILLSDKCCHADNKRDPVFVLAATQEAYDAMAAQLSVVIYARFHGVKPHPEYATAYVALSKKLLAAIGITPFTNTTRTS